MCFNWCGTAMCRWCMPADTLQHVCDSGANLALWSTCVVLVYQGAIQGVTSNGQVMALLLLPLPPPLILQGLPNRGDRPAGEAACAVLTAGLVVVVAAAAALRKAADEEVAGGGMPMMTEQDGSPSSSDCCGLPLWLTSGRGTGPLLKLVLMSVDVG